MKKILIILVLLSSLTFANQFGEGNKAIGITLGSGSVTLNETNHFGTIIKTNVEDYYILGVNAEFFVLENLSVGLGLRSWFGGDPTLYQGTIPVTYYIPTNSRFRPYLGAFYRYTYVSGDYENYSSAGGRAGLAITYQSGYIGLGWVQEYYLDGDSLNDSTSGYPEMIIGFSF